MEAVVMAAGEGRRLRPLTELYAKPVLPIDGRPVIAAVLTELRAAGIERVTIVTGHLAEQVETLVGAGSGFGVAVEFVRQPEPLGSADAVARALRGGASLPALVLAADTLFEVGDIARFREGAAGNAGAIAGRRQPPPAPPHRWPLAIEGGRVLRVLDDNAVNPVAGAPLWMLDDGVARFLDPLPGNPPYELSTAFQLAVDAGEVVVGIEIGRTRDLTRPADLIRENFPYLAAIEGE